MYVAILSIFLMQCWVISCLLLMVEFWWMSLEI